MSLTATTNSGSQNTTGSPQTAGGSSGGGAPSSSVQPGTATALLNSQNGIQLHATALSTVSLNPSTTTSTKPAAQPVPKHHANAALFGLSGLFIVLAIVLFWTAGRSVKTTT